MTKLLFSYIFVRKYLHKVYSLLTIGQLAYKPSKVAQVSAELHLYN
jgi:hypothetical protein